MSTEDVNTAIDRLLAPSPWVTRDHRATVEAEFSSATIERVNDLMAFACSPSEIWTRASSLTEAAAQVEPLIRDAHPDLTDRSVELLLDYACFSWK
ncbi:MAG: hypothetical protein AAF430_18350 [Myxococcota bacterium]